MSQESPKTISGGSGQEKPKRKKKESAKKEEMIKEPVWEVSEQDIREALRAEDSEETLRGMVIDGKVPLDAYDTVKEIVSALEETFDLEQRIEILFKLREQGKLPEELFYSFSAAILEEDSRSPEPVQLLKNFVGRAVAFSKRYQDREIPEEELNDLRADLGKFGYDKFKYVRSALGSKALAGVEEGTEEQVQEEIYNACRILFGDRQEKVLKGATELYRNLHKNTSLMINVRSRGKPLFNIESMFQLTRASREWLAVNPQLSAEEQRELRKDLDNVEEFLEMKAHEEVKQAVSGVRVREKIEKELEIAAKKILAINKELGEQRIGEADFEEASERMEQELRELEEKLRDSLQKIFLARSLPVAEELVKQTLFLNTVQKELLKERTALGRMGVQGAVPVPVEIKPEEEDLAAKTEARAIASELQAKVLEAYRADLDRKLTPDLLPKDQEAIRKRIAWADGEAKTLHDIAMKLRRGEEIGQILEELSESKKKNERR